MASRYDEKPQGFSFMDPRWVPGNLATNDGGATNSSYTENGPRPGAFLPAADSQLGILELSNGQENDVTVRCIQGGKAGAEGATFAFRLDSETLETDWYGWDSPCQPTMYSAAFWSDSITRDAINIAVFPQSQEPIVLMDGSVRRWDMSAQAWGTEINIGFTISTGANAIAVFPGTERVIVVQTSSTGGTFAISSYFSDDGGFAWIFGSYATFDDAAAGIGAASDQCSLAYNNNELLLIVRDPAGGGEWHQYASADDGATWVFVGLWSGFVQGADVVALRGGGFGLIYLKSDADDMAFRSIGTAFDAIDNATEVIITDLTTGASASGRQTGWVDPDGTLWAMCGRSFGSYLCYSPDGGSTWRICSYGMMDNKVTGSSLENWKSVGCAGGVMVIGNHTGVGSDEDGSVDAIWAGGWTKLEAKTDSPVASNYARSAQTRWGFGLAALTDFTSGVLAPVFGGSTGTVTAWNHTWFPFDLPDHTAGVYAISGTPGTLETPGMMQTAASVNYTKTVAAAGTSNKMAAFAEFTCSVGASLAQVMGFLVVNAAGTVSYNLTVEASATQFSITDANGATLQTVTVDMTGGICLRIRLDDGGDIHVQYRLRGMRGDWVVVDRTSTLADGGAAGTDHVLGWGEPAGGLTLQWYSFHSAIRLDSSNSYVWADGTVDADAQYGRWLTSYPMPIPAVGGTSDNFAHLATKGGPFLQPEDQTATVAYDFPIENIFPTHSPSPAQPWRSNATDTDVIIALNMGRKTRLDSTVGFVLYVGGTNLEEVVLEGFDGSWITLGTLTMATGFVGLAQLIGLSGDIMIPHLAATISAGRYVQHNEFAGGYATFSGGDTRKIATHSGGAWRQTTIPPDAAEAWFRLEDIDGGESGTVDLRGTQGVLIVSPTLAAPYQRFRLRIVAANNSVAEDYFQIGTAHLGAFTAVGKRWQRGFSRSLIPNTTLRRDTRGTIRRRQDGPPARRWVQSWPAGVDMLPLRSDANTDFISAGPTRHPLVARGDVRFQLMGALRASEGGALPVVAITDINDADAESINDKTRFIYGTLTGTIQANNVTGEEGAGEAERIESITISEIV